IRPLYDIVNKRGAMLHVLSDILGSVSVIIAGLVIRYTGWTPADTIASIAIAAIILPRALGLLRDALNILLERVPDGADTDEVERVLRTIPGEEDIHDLHIWSIDGREVLATCHIVVDADSEHLFSCGVLDRAEAELTKLSITHSTIQLEGSEHSDHETVC